MYVIWNPCIYKHLYKSAKMAAWIGLIKHSRTTEFWVVGEFSTTMNIPNRSVDLSSVLGKSAQRVNIQLVGQLMPKRKWWWQLAQSSLAACANEADIMFALDESGSISYKNFETVLNFVNTIVHLMPVEGNWVRIGLATYSDNERPQFSLDAFKTR